MKILYGIQGTGNGHLSRAIELIPYLKKYAEVDILLSGLHHDLEFEHEIKYKKKGLGFFFGKNGGVDLVKTIRKFNIYRFIKDIKSLPVHKYDMVISDFEPVTAWACRWKNRTCLGLSHQSALLNSRTPMPLKKNFIGYQILKNYAPCHQHISFHFQEYGHNMFTPVIRREIRLLEPENKGYFLVYLPAYSDRKIISALSQFRNQQWVVFSKHSRNNYREGNIEIHPVNGASFISSLKSCSGVLCGAGFETPAESLYLGKKLAVVPMKNQFEQSCNAYALQQMGIPVIEDLDRNGINNIRDWLHSGSKPIRPAYPDNAKTVVDFLMNHFLLF